MRAKQKRTLRIVLAMMCACMVPMGAVADDKDKDDQSKADQPASATQSATTQSSTEQSTYSSTTSQQPMTAEKFIQHAAVCSQKETHLAQLATQKSQNQEVKQFSQRLIQDHRQANQQLTQMAQSKGINLPPANLFANLGTGSRIGQGVGGTTQPGQTGTTTGESSTTPDSTGGTTTPSTSTVDEDSSTTTTTPPATSTTQPGVTPDRSTTPSTSTSSQTTSEQWRSSSSAQSSYGTGSFIKPEDRQMVQHMQSLSGSEFDKAFIKHMAQGHAKEIQKYEQASRQLQDTEVKNYVAQTLPKLREHHSQAQQIARSLGVNVMEDTSRSGSEWRRELPSTQPSSNPNTTSPSPNR
jgi:predicted outer membrane protein